MTDAPTVSTFGQYVRELRRRRGLTQRELAARVDVDFTYLSKIENDRVDHTPSIKALRDLARALDVDELELMHRANKVPPPLEAIARDRDALRFFRRATETIKSSEGWRDLLDYLDKRQPTGAAGADSGRGAGRLPATDSTRPGTAGPPRVQRAHAAPGKRERDTP